MAADGSIRIDVLLDDGTVVNGLANINNQVNNTANQSNTAFGRIGKGIKTVGKFALGAVVGVGALGAAAGGLAAPLVRAAGDLQALNAQFDIVFGELGKTATESLNKIGAETGVATGRLKGTFTQIAAFAKTSGADSAQALNITERATLAAADSAAFYDKSIEEVAESLQSFLKGNYANDAALGISATEFTRNAAAADLFGKKFNDLSEIQKQETLLKLVEDGNKLGGALGQAARETDGLENVLGNLKDAYETLKATLGNAIFDVAINGLKGLTQFINNFDATPLVNALGNIVNFLSTAFTAALPIVISTFTQIRDFLSTVFETIMPIIQSQVGGLTAFWQENGSAILATVSDSFNKVREVIQTVINTVVPFVQEQVAKITEFWKKDGEQILQAVTNAFNGIKAVIDFVMPAVLAVIRFIWDAIKNVITGALDVIKGVIQVFTGLLTGDFSKFWEGIKNIFSGAIDLIIGLMSLSFVGGIRTLVTNLFKSLVNVVKTNWNTILGFFRSFNTSSSNIIINLVKNVIQFFRNLFTSVTTTVTQLAQSVVARTQTIATGMINAIKGLPAKFLTYGKNIIQGLIDGIKGLASRAVAAIGNVASSMIDKVTGIFDINSPSRVMRQLGVFVGQGLALGVEDTEKMNQDAIAGVASVLSNAAKDVAKEVNDIAKKAEQERIKVQKTYADKRAAAETKNNTKTKGKAKKTLVDINKINQQEQEALKKINDKAAKDISNRDETLYSERLRALKTYVDDKKSTDNLSLSAEAEIYRKSLALFKEGSKERVEVQKAQNAALKKLYDEVATINTDYSKQINDVNQKFNDDSKKINDEYNNQLNSRIDSLRSFKSLFDEFNIDYEVSGNTLLNNLNAQVSGFRRFQNELSTLTSRGISKGLVEELQRLGPNAVSEIAALNRLTDSELTQYSNLFEEKSKLAKEQAVKELEGLRNSSDVEIEGLRIDAIKQIDKLNVEWSAKLKETTLATDTELSKLKQIGVKAVGGLLEGLQSQKSSLVNKAKELGTAIKDALSTSLNGTVNANVTGSSSISNPLQGVPLNLGMNNSSSAVNSAATTKATANVNNSKAAVNIQPAPVLIDSKKVADVTFKQTSSNIYNATSVNGLMKGVKI